MRLFLSEIKTIAYEASRFPETETGGDLYGLWTANGNPVVYLATGPGKNAKATSLIFEMDVENMKRSEDTMLASFGLQYLGDWHSHHHLPLDRPSLGDQQRIRTICRNNNRSRMCEIIVNHVEEDGVIYEKISAYVYVHNVLHSTEVCVLAAEESPIRRLLPLTFLKNNPLSLQASSFPLNLIMVT